MTYLENKFKDAGKFRYGRAFVETLDGKTYCINKKGKVLFEYEGKGELFNRLPIFNKFKQAIVKNLQGDLVITKIIDINGNNVITYQENKASINTSVKNPSLCSVITYLESKSVFPTRFGYHIIDHKTGIEDIILPIGKTFKGHKGLILDCNDETQVEFMDNKLLFYNLAGNLINECNFESFHIEHGVADRLYYSIQQNDKWGFVDFKGNLILPYMYDKNICFKSERKQYFEVVKKGKVGVVDKNNKTILECEFDDIVYFQYSFLVLKDDKWTLKSLNGKTKKLPYDGYEFLLEFGGACNSKYIVVVKNGKQGLCTAKGEIILPPKFDSVYSIDKGNLLRVRNNCKRGYYDLNGNEVIPCEYDELWFGVHDGLIAAQKDGKIGYINIKNETIIPFIYEFTPGLCFYKGVAIVNVNSEYNKYIKTNGEDLF